MSFQNIKNEEIEMGIDFRECGDNTEPLLRNTNERTSLRSNHRQRMPKSPSAASLAAVAEQIARNEVERKTLPKIRIPSHASSLNLIISPELPEPNVYNLIPESLHGFGGSSSLGSTPSPLPSGIVVGPVCRWRRSDRRKRRLNTELIEAAEIGNFKWAEKCLKHGASPNATCRLDGVSALHLAALTGHNDILAELLKKGADRERYDRHGLTPLHLAAWSGNTRCVALLLDFPEGIISDLETGLTLEIEEGVRKSTMKMQAVIDLVNVKSVPLEGKLQFPKEWKDSFEHECKDIREHAPPIEKGSTPLHVACSHARALCVRLLLAAGASLHALDGLGRTPFDVLGLAHRAPQAGVTADEFLGIAKILLDANAPHNTMKLRGNINDMTTPLHVAVEMENLDAIRLLLGSGANPGSFNEDGETPLHLAVLKHMAEPFQILVNTWSSSADPFVQPVNLKNRKGYTALQTAVDIQWVSGVCTALEAGADVSVQSNGGETAVHAAAAGGDLNLLMEILSVAKRTDVIECVNEAGETALFKSIIYGHLECARALMKIGASPRITLPGELTAIHKAAEFGHADILAELLTIDKTSKKSTIDAISTPDFGGLSALHFACYHNHPECVKLLLSAGANIRVRTTSSPHFESTPLHLACYLGNKEVIEVLVNFDQYTVMEVNFHGWQPIHVLSHHGHRECIPAVLQAGADLSAKTFDPKGMRRTAVNMLVNNISRPADYLEDLFDSYISVNGLSLEDSNCEVLVDYSVLIPKDSDVNQMGVITALLGTGNRYDQKRLLMHPLIESYLYLKWRALSPFFYIILMFYALFVIALSSMVVEEYYYKENGFEVPVIFNFQIWTYVLIVSITLIAFQEILYMRQDMARYFGKLETWVKFGSIGLSCIVASVEHDLRLYDWPRHITTLAVLLAWTELMFLLSRFPNWGYYVLMFSKVAMTVIKVLLTFVFLIMGFSFSFMIQFRSEEPFEHPWAAFVKTMVMMTSEFDYSALFDHEHGMKLGTSMLVGRIIFVAFLVLTSIVLMNLMVGVAVSDINDLEIQGKIQRLSKQVDFLASLDIAVYNRFFKMILPSKITSRIKAGRNVMRNITIYPGRPRWSHDKHVPTSLKDSIFLKATKQKRIKDETLALQNFSKLIDEIHAATVKRFEKKQKKFNAFEGGVETSGNVEERPRKVQIMHTELVERINDLATELREVKGDVTGYIKDTQSPIHDIGRKLDQIYKEIDYLGTTLKKVLASIPNKESEIAKPLSTAEPDNLLKTSF